LELTTKQQEIQDEHNYNQTTGGNRGKTGIHETALWIRQRAFGVFNRGHKLGVVW
jgi:hypothetical protein